MRTTFYDQDFRLEPLRLLQILTLSGLSLLVAGCPASKENPPAVPVAADKIRLKGSNTVGEELAPRLAGEYRRDHPKVAIEIDTKGTGYGFAGLCAGICEIAAGSRSMLKGEEEQLKVRGVELNDYVIGTYSVAVIANAANSTADLTRAQVRDIFTGAVQNWKQVGGSDAPIHLCIRDPISGTYLGFRELAMDNKDYTVASTAEFTNYTGIAEAVAKDQNAIGYVSPDLAGKSGVKAISIGGVAPTVAAVRDGTYPFARVLHLYTVKPAEPPLAKEFIQYVLSAPGQKIVADMGFVPRP